MNTCRSLLALCFCIALHFHSFAQDHDLDGYYIDLKGDTIFGKYSNYQEYQYSPSAVPFQPAGSSAPISLTPDKCKMLSIGQADKYLSFHGKKLTNSIDLQTAQMGVSDVYEEVTVFIRELFNDGHYQLYELSDAKRFNFYVASASTPLEELYYKQGYVQNAEQENAAMESKVYLRQLTAFFAVIIEKDPSSGRYLNSVRYADKPLINLFTRITNGKKIAASKQKHPAKFFIGIGASVNSLSHDQPITNYNYVIFTYNDAAGKYGIQVSPVYEAGVKLFTQRNRGRLFFMLRADYYKFANSTTVDGLLMDTIYTTFKSTVISFPASIGYKFIDHAHFSLELSAGLSYLLLPNNVQVTTVYPAKTTNIRDSKDPSSLGYFGEAAAVLFNKVSVLAGYYAPVGISSATAYNFTHTSIKFGLRYNLF